MRYFCRHQQRAINVGKHPILRGIDFVDVSSGQNELRIHFVPSSVTGKAAAPAGLTIDNVRINGGERITSISAKSVSYQGEVLVVGVEDDGNPANGVGDFAPYTLELRNVPSLDPLLSAVEFSFKIECAADFPCAQEHVCPQESSPSVQIDYLARDYASFRRLMLDRMALLMPQWREQSPADLGVALVELLAYIGDQLSYRQDAIGTEAYLGTARRRISARRHARLVDYFMHDGCNARVWVMLQAATGVTGLLVPGPSENKPGAVVMTRDGAAAFETMHDLNVYEDHNEILFYTWGDADCCLPKGATSATLKGSLPNLKRGDVLIFEEVLGPDTGLQQDANPANRHVVRITAAHQGITVDPINNQEVTAIEWSPADALPFPLCLREFPSPADPSKKLTVSVAHGNVVLADHGRTIRPAEKLGKAPQASRFRPSLQQAPLTQARTILKTITDERGRKKTIHLSFDPDAPASDVYRTEWKHVLPAVSLNDGSWKARRDLLSGGAFAREFVAECEDGGTAFLRFGDDLHGKRPEPDAEFTAVYRVGNGTAGNVGSDAIVQLEPEMIEVVGVRNPLPARGGVDPETIEEVRQRAPYAFRVQERAVTEKDYADVVQRDTRIQRAAATFRWTGSWHTVFLTVDRLQGMTVDREFKTEVRDFIERYRMAGYDLEVNGPRLVSLEIEIEVCVKPDYFRADVKTALLEVLSNRQLPDGGRGVFHPDNMTFGQTVFLSPIYAAAQAVAGVASIEVKKFQRQGTIGVDFNALDEGRLEMGRLEIARLDNDPNFPEHGVLRLKVGGGK